MPSSRRRKIRSIGAAVVLFLALLAMVVTGFGTGGMGDLSSLAGGQSPTTIATVEGEDLTEAEARERINRAFNQARQQQPNLGLAEFVAEAFNPLVDQLINGIAAAKFAEGQGLVASERMIDRLLLEIPDFRNLAGQYDPAVLAQRLQALNMTEGQLRRELRQQLLIRQLLGPLASGERVPDAFALQYASADLERRRGTIGVVPTELMAAGIDPTEAEVIAYYQRNRARFTVPERRVLKYAMIGRDQVAARIRATDAEIQQYYQQNAGTYGPRETRDLQQVVLPDQAAAQRFADSVRGGTAFAAAAQAVGFSAGDIAAAGQSREQFAGRTSPEVATAAFGAAQGALVGPIRSPLGFHVVQVQAISRTAARTLDTVRAEIVQTIEQRKLVDALADLVGRIEERIDDGASLEEIARAEGLALATTAPVTAAGRVEGQAAPLGAELQPLLRSAFEIDAEEPEPLVETVEPNLRYALVGIERVLAAAPPPLARIRDEVRTALIRERALARGRTVAQQIVQRVNGGMPMQQAFSQAGGGLPAPEPVEFPRGDIRRARTQAPAPLVMLFALPQGRADMQAAPNGAGWIIVHHIQRTPGNAAGNDAAVTLTRSELQSQAEDEIQAQFVRAIEGDSDIERNGEAITRLRRSLVQTLAE